MAYVYKCPQCKTNVELARREVLRCATCGVEMQIAATSQWLFKCHQCGETIQGGPETQVTSVRCPFCDDGMLCPSRPI